MNGFTNIDSFNVPGGVYSIRNKVGKKAGSLSQGVQQHGEYSWKPEICFQLIWHWRGVIFGNHVFSLVGWYSQEAI